MSLYLGRARGEAASASPMGASPGEVRGRDWQAVLDAYRNLLNSEFGLERIPLAIFFCCKRVLASIHPLNRLSFAARIFTGNSYNSLKIQEHE